jgi:hypothetical protein
MLVFGDRSHRANPRERLAAIASGLAEVADMSPGIARHSALTGTLIEGGRLLQGIADAEFAQRKQDRASDASDALTTWLLGVGHLLRRSWDSGFAELGELPAAPQVAAVPASVELKSPEGFAYYAVYPEAYLEAARRLRLDAPPRVIGIRSIGTTLASVVAAALDAGPPVTVRPFGDPFARQVTFDAALERRLLEGNAHYVIVDEGPGLSGSSFGAVADWLEDRGVARGRIAFLPSHGGPLGPAASVAHGGRWHQAQRVVADFGDRLPRLAKNWAAELLGSIPGEPRDLSAGQWRRLSITPEVDWPPAIAMFERRKFLLEGAAGQVMAKFAGLGAIGEEKLELARTLYEADFVPEPIGLVHGFLIERWREDAKPLGANDRPVEAIGRYIGARARAFPAEANGASIVELYEMARRNISLGLGCGAAQVLRRWEPHLDRLQARVRRVRTDSRLDRHEWLRTIDGRLLKTDAVDHHQAHDLIGCQDVTWDVAGAAAEFDLDDGSRDRLIGATEQAFGKALDRELLEFCDLTYASFRFGLASLSADLAHADIAEQTRMNVTSTAYRHRLQRLLEPSRTSTRQARPVG